MDASGDPSPAHYLYRAFSHAFEHDEGLCEAFGIELLRNMPTGMELIDRVAAVTTRFEFASRLIDLLNRAQVSPCHFRDVLEDFLSADFPASK